MEFLQILHKLIDKENLTDGEAAFALEEIMQGKINNAQIAAFLTGLKIKGESIEEIAAFVKIMRKNAINFFPKVKNLVDTAGTGGDGSKTFNISTCAAFVAAGAGANVAKHGNRAASSKSGSADVLEELGINSITEPTIAEKQLEGIGITFLFAPAFHHAMKFVAPVRKELGFKTVFNILGPLTNPAGAKRQLIGAYDKSLLKKLAEVLKLLGTEKTLLVSSDIDEISICSETELYEITNGEIKNYNIIPEDFGFKRASLDAIRVEDKTKSAEVLLNVLKGRDGAARDIVLLNSGAAIYASGIANNIQQGISLAEKSIDSGKALEKLELLRNFKA
ncbi:anthranilate phosphoribosyltransferase [Candidatus Micrarchaeota archaeon]|nr:anthranilate phosphoribosyltransferase [Candidatus Micrarchaeota archaeon]